MTLDKKFLDDLVAANQRNGISWQAAETSMLHLAPGERKARLGYVPGPNEPSLQEREQRAASAHQAMKAAASPNYPAAWDWRNVNGNNYISAIKDQGSCGSCVAFGTAAALEGTARVKTNTALNSPNAYTLQDLSEAQLFYCGAEGQQGRTCATGWWVEGALSYAQNPGVAPEDCFRYEAGDQPCQLNSGWQGQLTKLSQSHTLSSAADMKQWLATRGPLISCFTVYQDFYGYSQGVYRWNKEAPAEGGHCICVVGYSEALQAWLCKNSWGTGWGMDGYFYIGYGQCGIDSTMWAIDSFARIQTGPSTLWSSGDMGQGPGAVDWQIGDINGDGQAELVQMWANGSSLGMIVYGWREGQMKTLWSTGDMGQGPGAVAWQIGDVNGDGKAEIIQQWAHGSSLGTIVYGWNGSAMTTLWSSDDMGQGPGAVAWQIGDINGDGRAEIIQQWAHGSSLGTIVYGWSNGAMSTLWSSDDMGQGPGAVAWQIGDINGDGKQEIIQQWANGGRLGTIVYGWNGSALATLWSTADIGQGPGAVTWQIGDIDGDGKAEIIQGWDNGSLGMIVYGWNGTGLSTKWDSGNMGQGPGAVQWLVGDVNGDGRAEIIQQWGNGSSLGTIIYGWNGTAMTTLWACNNMGQGPGAVNWSIGKVNGSHNASILQQWAHGSSLGMIVYGYPAV